MLGLNGGLMGVRKVPTTGAASGVWVPNEQVLAKRAGIWPIVGPAAIPDIGGAYQGGFFAGYISHTENGVATHALIVAPRATGASGTGYTLTTNYACKTAATATSGTTSPFDGAANTAAMVTAGIADHPAANFCVGLSIDGYSDWYLPSRYELDIAYENLKPTTANNSTFWGVNPYSVPRRTVDRTTGLPAQTSVAAFQSGGGEDFVNERHWSSTEDLSTSTNGWRMSFADGAQLNEGKTAARRVRAFRRVAL
jgi:hypothetical protein